VLRFRYPIVDLCETVNNQIKTIWTERKYLNAVNFLGHAQAYISVVSMTSALNQPWPAYPWSIEDNMAKCARTRVSKMYVAMLFLVDCLVCVHDRCFLLSTYI
jgi:hypothetical protein